MLIENKLESVVKDDDHGKVVDIKAKIANCHCDKCKLLRELIAKIESDPNIKKQGN